MPKNKNHTTTSTTTIPSRSIHNKPLLPQPSSIQQEEIDLSTITIETNPSAMKLTKTAKNLMKDAYVILYQLLVFINSLISGVAYLMIVFQTIQILNDKEPKYINLRHVALKWLICLVISEIKSGFMSSETLSAQVAILCLNIALLMCAYPSKLMKEIHLKYFSQKQNQRYTSSMGDPNSYDLSFGSRLIISLSVFLLRISKHLIAFVQPNHRKPIEEGLRDVNAVVLDQKCFWSIYENNKKEDGGDSGNGSEQHSSSGRDKNVLRDYLLSASNYSNNNYESMSQSLSLKKSTTIPKSQLIKAHAQKCSNHSLKPLKKIVISYYPSTSVLEILDMDFGKIESYLLEQIEIKDQANKLLLMKGSKQGSMEEIIAQFRTGKDMLTFMKSIEEAQRNI